MTKSDRNHDSQDKNSFVFLRSYLESAEAFDKINPKLGDELLLAIVRYGITGEKSYTDN